MLEALIVVTILEALLLVAVLALYLLTIMRRLRAIAELLGHIAFGVRAIETQVGNAGPAVGDLNRRLANLSETLEHVDRSVT